MSNQPVILVVDDSAVNRAVLFDYLDGRGYRVLVAETGEAAVDTTSLAHPDIILMDVMLPGIDGYEACRQIRSLPRGGDVPILFMSGMDDNPSKAEGFKAGGNAYLTKPVLYDEIASLLEAYLALQTNKSVEGDDHPEDRSALSEFDSLIDIIAHDMKGPIVCTLGFADELATDFAEREDIPEEWIEYTSIIRKSSGDIDVILEALVLLKNLRLRTWSGNELISLRELLESVQKRYDSLENLLPLELEKNISADTAFTEATLLEELVLILFRTLCYLNAEAGDTLSIVAGTKKSESGHIILTLDAKTRTISSQELPYILEPMHGGKRKKVKDTNLLTICAQKIIEYLAINAWSEQTDDGLRFNLSLSGKK